MVFSLLLLHHSESKKALKDIHAFSCILIELCVYVTTSNRRDDDDLWDLCKYPEWGGSGVITPYTLNGNALRIAEAFMNLERYS